jgi:hypothetical protein
MTNQEMRTAVMSELASKGVEKRHKGMTKQQKARYYSRLRRRLDPKTGKRRGTACA